MNRCFALFTQLRERAPEAFVRLCVSVQKRRRFAKILDSFGQPALGGQYLAQPERYPSISGSKFAALVRISAASAVRPSTARIVPNLNLA